MIYLIDDKKDRQAKDYNWNFDKLSKYKNELKPIYSLQQIDNENLRDNIFSEDSIIFIHESFFENIENKHIKDSLKIREDLREKALKKNIWLVYFSGSKSSRAIDGRIAHIPVSILYKNLEIFIEKKIEKKIDLNYILFGKNPKIESELINKLEKSNNDFDSSEILTNSYNLFFHVEGRQNLPLRINNSVIGKLIVGNEFENHITDLYLHNQVNNFLTINEYENVFIPLCFGPTLSDYNGLRLATHIRCTSTKNQLKPIFIYGFVDYTFLIENEYFDILKTKNVFLIGYSKKCFEDALNIEISDLTIDFLSQEIKKINLKIPSNYEDNHSIANVWAIYRWSQIIGANDENIEKITELQNSNLYFKYLKTIYPISQVDKLDLELLKIEYEGKPKILYIDDEAEKGWYEIFDELLHKNNKLSFYHLDDEFNETAQDEIIDLSIKTVIEKDIDIDLVILDFRLHNDDFKNIPVQDVTGYKILKKIKEYNKGIQVIIFSATNKILNLQALQEAGADGFIIKESPENSIDSEFTKQSILNMIQSLEKCLKMTFLKEIYKNIEKIKTHLNSISNITGDEGLEGGLMKMKFKNEIFIQLDIIFDCLKRSSADISTEIRDESSYLNLSFTSIYKIIELINDFYTDERGRKLKSNSIDVQMYNQNSNEFSKIVEGFPNNKDKIYTVIKFELNDEPSNYVQKFNKFHRDRNNITHPRTLKDYKKTTVEENMRFLSLVADLLLKIN
jgi:CheY-like chemotaxis protein